MEGRQGRAQGNGHSPLVADLPTWVIVALDQVTDEEKERIFAAVEAFARGEEVDARRLPGPQPIYVLRVTPEVRVVVRREPDAPIEVEDIFRPAVLRQFTNV